MKTMALKGNKVQRAQSLILSSLLILLLLLLLLFFSLALSYEPKMFVHYHILIMLIMRNHVEPGSISAVFTKRLRHVPVRHSNTHADGHPTFIPSHLHTKLNSSRGVKPTKKALTTSMCLFLMHDHDGNTLGPLDDDDDAVLFF